MKPEISDVTRTLEYGHSHDLAQRFMPVALGGVALGLFLTVPLDGTSVARDSLLVGWIVVALSLLFAGIIVVRRTQPSVPYIVVSERGVLFKLAADRVIPWDEIRAVDRDLISAPRDLLSTKVVRLTLSRRFYETLTQERAHDGQTGVGGDPSYIYLAYFLHVPHDELYAAVRRRWRAFSRHAAGVTDTDEDTTTASPADKATPRGARASVVQRAGSFEELGALVRLLAGGSIWRLTANVVALVVIAGLVTNHMGLWATARQERARADQAAWKAWQEKHEAEQRALDAEVRRTQDMWDRKFDCMNQYWDQLARGTYRGDPECMKEK